MTPKEMCNSCTHEITAWVHITRTIGAAITPERIENMKREECHEYVIDDYHARQNRKKFRIVR